MLFPLTPARLWFLFSVAGYTKAEIHGLTLWSPEKIDEGVARWNLPWWSEIGGRGEIYERIEMIRKKQGREAALEAIETFLQPLVGPHLSA